MKESKKSLLNESTQDFQQTIIVENQIPKEPEMRSHVLVSLWRRIESKINENQLITEDEFINNIYGELVSDVQDKKLIGVGGYIHIKQYFTMQLISDFFSLLLLTALIYMIYTKNIQLFILPCLLGLHNGLQIISSLYLYGKVKKLNFHINLQYQLDILISSSQIVYYVGSALQMSNKITLGVSYIFLLPYAAIVGYILYHYDANQFIYTQRIVHVMIFCQFLMANLILIRQEVFPLAINLIFTIVIFFYQFVIGLLLFFVFLSSIFHIAEYKILSFKKIGVFVLSTRNLWSGVFGLMMVSKYKQFRDPIIFKSKVWNPELIDFNQHIEKLDSIKHILIAWSIMFLLILFLQKKYSNQMMSFLRLIVFRNENLYYVYQVKYIEKQQHYLYKFGYQLFKPY